MLTIEILKNLSYTVDLNEAYRYMGCGKNPSLDIVDLSIKARNEILATATPRICYCRVPISIADETVDFGAFKVTSKNLADCLKNCSNGIIFAATLGSEIDRLIIKKSVISPAEQLVYDAVCSAAVEGLLNAFEDRLTADMPLDEKGFTNRFSPGYGNFNLSHQRDFISLLETYKNIGVALTDKLLMVPAKSVTGVIGRVSV